MKSTGHYRVSQVVLPAVVWALAATQPLKAIDANYDAFRIHKGWSQEDMLGTTVAGLGDLNGDGAVDIAHARSGAPNVVYFGRTQQAMPASAAGRSVDVASIKRNNDPDGPRFFNSPGPGQLGLKLESSRGPVDVMVIDSVQRPSETDR